MRKYLWEISYFWKCIDNSNIKYFISMGQIIKLERAVLDMYQYSSYFSGHIHSGHIQEKTIENQFVPLTEKDYPELYL